MPNVIINDGEFIGKHGSGLYIWLSAYDKKVQLKGGIFKGYDEENITITCGEEDIVIERKLVAFVSPVLKF